jgi:tetratricopeptide (TPR) repeat protein
MGCSSVELFVARVQDTIPTFALTEANAEDVAAVCASLEGVPLAIELAAARAEHLSPGEISAGLVSRLEMLTEGARDLPARHRTLRGAIEWSYNLLGDAEKTLFGQLGVFVGGFSLEAVEAVCRRVGAGPTVQLLFSLAETSLVKEARSRGGRRFGMLETVREYAVEKLGESGQAEEVEREHARYFMTLAERAEPYLTGPDQVDWLDRLENEHDNFRVALRWAREASRRAAIESERSAEAAEVGLRTAKALNRFWYKRGYIREGREQLAAMLTATSFDRPQSTIQNPKPKIEKPRAAAFLCAGILAHLQGEYSVARALYDESLAIRRELDDKKGIAEVLGQLSMLAGEQGDHQTALALEKECLVILQEINDTAGLAGSLTRLGIAAYEQGDYVTARTNFEESLALHRARDDRRGIAFMLNNLGILANVQGDHLTARTFFEEGLTIWREFGDQMGISHALNQLAVVAHELGDYRTARDLQQESLIIRRKAGSTIHLIENLVGLGRLGAAVGDPQRGARLLGATARLWEAQEIEPERDLRRQYKLGLTSTRSQLGEEDFERTWAEGQAMTMEEAIAYALEEG